MPTAKRMKLLYTKEHSLASDGMRARPRNPIDQIKISTTPQKLPVAD